MIRWDRILLGWFPLLACGLVSSAPASAAEPADWRIQARAGWAFGESREGPGLGLTAERHLFDLLYLGLDLDFMSQGGTGYSKSTTTAPGIVFDYDLDLLPVVPSLALGFGPLFERRGSAWETDVFWMLGAGLGYRATPGLTVGVSARNHYRIRGNDKFNVSLAATLTLGW